MLKYRIHYVCYSDVGKARRMNQDNYICNGRYTDDLKNPPAFPLAGTVEGGLFGVFDGMGGEECGEVASLITSECAAALKKTEDAKEDLLNLCTEANEKICAYVKRNELSSMGTTAAMLDFREDGVTLCNIGDSKIFRLRRGEMSQLSVDHYAIAAFGMKPPLSQSLGIDPEEMLIDPHVTQETCEGGDVWLICSDGLTDMVPTEDIQKILQAEDVDRAAEKLLSEALARGGRDNVTIILCGVIMDRLSLFDRIRRFLGGRGE